MAISKKPRNQNAVVHHGAGTRPHEGRASHRAASWERAHWAGRALGRRTRGGHRQHAAGRIVSQDGTAEYGAHLRVGDTSRALFGPGLVDARGAHVVLALKTHGPKIPELVSEQLSTLAGGCNSQDDVPPGAPQELVGTPGPNDCAEIQFTVHGSQ